MNVNRNFKDNLMGKKKVIFIVCFIFAVALIAAIRATAKIRQMMKITFFFPIRLSLKFPFTFIFIPSSSFYF